MVNTYKSFSIIYGGTGRKCAERIHARIQELHDNEGIPVTSDLLADPFLDSKGIVNKVINILKKSDACIILLTFEDVNATRVRQNVLVEIGMALVLLGRENCYAVSDKSEFPEGFPSDLRGALNLNPMNISDADNTAKDIVEELRAKYSLETNRNILKTDDYTFNYRDILKGIKPKVYEKESTKQMKAILDFWTKNIQSFTYTEERIYYILERVTFFPIFSHNKHLKHFFKDIIEAISIDVKDIDGNESITLVECRGLVTNVIEYIDFVQGFGEHHISNTEMRHTFSYIADKIEAFLEKCQNGIISVGWYIKIIAHDYAALAKLKYIQSLDDTSEEKIVILKNIIDHFQNVELIISNDIHRESAKALWYGYTKYNLSRSYEQLYRCYEASCKWDNDLDENNNSYNHLSNKVTLLKKIRSTCNEAIMYRRKWMQKPVLKGILGKALSYEYFIAKKHEYELRQNLSGYSDESKEQTLHALRDTISLLNVYCEETGMRKLLSIKDSLVEMEFQMR